MQGEHEAALQSLDIVLEICGKRSRQHSESVSLSSSESDEEGVSQPLRRKKLQQTPAAVQADHQGSGSKGKATQTDKEQYYTYVPGGADVGLVLKALLGKASVLKQLQRHTEADECMQHAKAIDPDIGKYVKQ